MREAGTQATIGELMGKSGAKSSEDMSIGKIKELLGEKMPEIKFNTPGKIRLLQALQIRFGNGFRNIPGIKKILSEFDNNMKTEVMAHKIRAIKMKKDK